MAVAARLLQVIVGWELGSITPSFGRTYIRFKYTARVGFCTGALLIALVSAGQAANIARACAASPYRVGDSVTRFGPPGDEMYNGLKVRRIYVLFGSPHPSECLAVPTWCRSHPSPAYLRVIEGWLYRTSGVYTITPGTPATLPETAWNWYARGVEMDEPLAYVPDPIAVIVTRTAHLCR
jgi:hypothetical protein